MQSDAQMTHAPARSRLQAWRSRSERPWDASSRIGLTLLCAALYLGLGLKYPNFLTADNFFITLLSVTSIGVAAIGMTALLISGNVDLSIGGQYAFIGMVTGIVARDLHNTTLAILAGLVCGALLGYTNGRLVRLLRISPLIVTLGVGTILHGIAFVISGGLSAYGFPSRLTHLGQTYFGPVPLPVVIGGIVFLIVSVALLRTVGGLRTYAIGGNANAARLSGIDVDRYVTGLFAMNGTLIGLVSVMTVARLGSASPTVGVGFELDVLTAAILGGVSFIGGSGHPFGVFVGVFTIGVLNAGIIFAGVADFWQQVVQGGALLVALGADQWTSHRRAQRRTAAQVEDLAAEQEEDHSTRAAQEAHSPRSDFDEVVVACEGLTKYFGSVRAVQDVGFAVRAGEVVCLIGDNGAGKSTVIKMLSGATRPDAGVIAVKGTPVDFEGPADAQAYGIATAYQDLALCPNLGVAENLVLGREPRKTNWGILSWRDDAAGEVEARKRLAALNIVLGDYRRPVNLLSGGQRQSVAIARAAQNGSTLVILDEPTAALGIRQTRSVVALVRTLARSGVGVIVITHDIDIAFDLADRFVVLRLGRLVFDGPAASIEQGQLIHLMAGYRGSVGSAVEAPTNVG
jgi:ribose/xylose/arabinose/galactoside ABC-type transport system permease subunit/ABC-type branched-subunit amino acid transport system ATPase component